MASIRALVIGLGNPDRGDDGFGHEIISALRSRCGCTPLDDHADELRAGDGPMDSVCWQQLSPEWLEVAAGYERLVFVDVHVHADRPDLWCVPVCAGLAAAPFTHHLTPPMFVALLSGLYGRKPDAWIVSARGRDFCFGRGLSAETAAQIQPAMNCILQLAQPGGEGPDNAPGVG